MLSSMDVSQGAHKKASDDLFGKLPVLSLSKVQFVTSPLRVKMFSNSWFLLYSFRDVINFSSILSSLSSCFCRCWQSAGSPQQKGNSNC